MSRVKTDLCVLILKELYGEDHAKVGGYLLKNGKLSLRMIATKVELPLSRVKKVLAHLTQQNIVHFTQHKRGHMEYVADCWEILCRMRFQHYLWSIKQTFAGIGDLILEDMLQNGQVLMSEVILRVHEKWNLFLQSKGKAVLTDTSKVKETFKTLAATHFLQRCPQPERDAKSRVVGLKQPESPELRYVLPDVDTDVRPAVVKKETEADDSPPAKKRAVDAAQVGHEKPKDEGIYWRVNFQRIHLHIRDEVLCEAVEKRMGEKAKIIMQTILRMNETGSAPNPLVSAAVAKFDIFRQLPQSSGITEKMLADYLVCMADPPEHFLRKIDDSGGGTYVINLFEIMKMLATGHIEMLIQESYGSQSLRIFRAVVHANFIEQRELDPKVMIKPGNAKELLYNLIEENFIEVQELPKTQEWTPKSTVYLYHVDMNRLARNVLEKCYKAVHNEMVKKQQIWNDNRRLLDKDVRVEYIINTLAAEVPEDQKVEIEAMISPVERKTLNSISEAVKKLDRAEKAVQRTIFVLETYLEFVVLEAEMNAPVKRRMKSCLQDL